MALRIFTEPQQGASYQDLLTFARTAEQTGFSAFFRSDHVLKMGSVSGLPAITDAWITLAGLARDTSTIRLGTLVTPVTFRPVGTFPVTAAQVDHMSGGRLEIGLGAGWYEDEHQRFGLAFPPVSERYDQLEDALAILDGVWSAEPGSTFAFTGRTCSVELQADVLKPFQTPGPPVVLGGQGGPRSARMAASYAAEYNTAFVPVDRMKGIHDKVRKACDEAGRDPATVTFSVGQVVCCGRTEADIGKRAAAIGRDVAELRGKWSRRYAGRAPGQARPIR